MRLRVPHPHPYHPSDTLPLLTEKQNQEHLPAKRIRQPLFPGHQPIVWGGGVRVHGTLHRMDAVAELTWTYLQRVP